MRRLASALISVLAVVISAWAADPPPPASSFVFDGTVESVGTLASLDAGAPPETIMVRVDKPLRSRGGAIIPAGTVVRVRLDSATAVKEGDKRRFSTDAVAYGDVVTLHGSAAAVPGPGALAGMPGEPGSPAADQKVKAADLVVSGVVKRVRPLSEERRAALASLPRQRTRSEHDAEWHEAEIEVKAVAKGDPAVKTVTILFPASEDRRWHDQPKFKEEEAKVFFLHKDQIRDPDVRGALLMSVTQPAPPANHAGAYTALKSADVQDASTFAAVRSAAQHQ